MTAPELAKMSTPAGAAIAPGLVVFVAAWVATRETAPPALALIVVPAATKLIPRMPALATVVPVDAPVIDMAVPDVAAERILTRFAAVDSM